MPLTQAELEGIQADAMADDIAIEFERMQFWTAEQAQAYFATGVEPPPPWRPDAYFMRKLEENGLSHLSELLCVEKKHAGPSSNPRHHTLAHLSLSARPP